VSGRTLVRLVAIGLGACAVAFAVAFFIPWLPEQASEQRERIDFVFWLTTAICIAIFGVVVAISLFAVAKFRVRPDDDSDGAPIHGHTGLEIVWTAVPAILVTIIGVWSAVVLAQNENASANALRVRVTAQQFAWNFTYPNGTRSTTLRLPVNRDTKLTLTANDVIHSFWVREFGQKMDALPGQTTELVITPKKVGSYDVICTELCGLGHAVMRAKAVVMTPARYAAWYRRTGRQAAGPPGEAGAAVFREQGCGSCHTFTPAGTNATAGPNLDQLAQQARRAGKPLEAFTRESIVAPDVYVERGFSKDLMPENYDALPDQQVDALVQYLVAANQGAK